MEFKKTPELVAKIFSIILYWKHVYVIVKGSLWIISHFMSSILVSNELRYILPKCFHNNFIKYYNRTLNVNFLWFKSLYMSALVKGFSDFLEFSFSSDFLLLGSILVRRIVYKRRQVLIRIKFKFCR